MKPFSKPGCDQVAAGQSADKAAHSKGLLLSAIEAGARCVVRRNLPEKFSLLLLKHSQDRRLCAEFHFLQFERDVFLAGARGRVMARLGLPEQSIHLRQD
jgi:hypothetical protein